MPNKIAKQPLCAEISGEILKKTCMELPKICMLTTQPLDFDSRILNEAETLTRFYNVTILAKKHDKFPEILKKTPFKFKRIKYQKLHFSFLNIISAFWALSKACLKENPDFFHAHDLDGLLCAFLPAIFFKKILIYDSHELWTEGIVVKNKPFLKPMVIFLERLLILKVKKIITVNLSLGKILHQKYHKEVLALYNYPNFLKINFAKSNIKKRFPRKKIIIYVGSFQKGRGLEAIIESARFLDDTYLILLIGYGPEKNNLAQKIHNAKLEKKVQFYGPFPPDRVVQNIAGADLGLSLIENVSLSYFYSTPNKLFQYIAAEIPILGSNLPEMRRIVLENRIGEVINSQKPQLLAEKIIEMTRGEIQKKYRTNLKGLAKNKYNWEIEGQKLLDFYRNI